MKNDFDKMWDDFKTSHVNFERMMHEHNQLKERAAQLEALEAEKSRLPGEAKAGDGTENGQQQLHRGREDSSGAEEEREAEAGEDQNIDEDSGSGGGDSGDGISR